MIIKKLLYYLASLFKPKMRNGFIKYSDGDKIWWLNDQIHRKDGPAIEYSNGTKEWFVNGQRHREDGPAIEWINGTKLWYLNGQLTTEEEVKRYELLKDLAGIK